MSGVTLSPAIRSMLLSLQGTAAQTSAIQSRLATGRKVNSALDNPRNYFTAQSLGARAGDLNALLDNMAQARQTVKAVNQSIGSLTGLVQAARSLAHQARVSPPSQVNYAAIEQIGSANAGGETIGSVTGSVDVGGAFTADVEGLQIQVGASTFTVHNPSSPTPAGINAIVTRINNTAGFGSHGAVTASLDSTGHAIRLIANSSDISFQVLPSAAASALGIAGQFGASTNLLEAVPGLAGTSMTVQAEGGTMRTVNFGTAGSQVSTFEELQSALSASGATVSIDAGGGLKLSVDASLGTPNALTTNGTALAALGLPAGHKEFGVVGATTPDPSRVSYQTQYNSILQQIDALARDSSYAGINLLRGDSLRTAFNESGSSELTIAGVSLGASGLGLSTLTGDAFQSDAVVDNTLTTLDAAMADLRTQASRFGSGLSTLQTREDFTRTLIGTLQTGVSDLVLADSNEEGANMLALRTRQELSVTALSLAAEGDRAVLRLFA